MITKLELEMDFKNGGITEGIMGEIEDFIFEKTNIPIISFRYKKNGENVIGDVSIQ